MNKEVELKMPLQSRHNRKHDSHSGRHWNRFHLLTKTQKFQKQSADGISKENCMHENRKTSQAKYPPHPSNASLFAPKKETGRHFSYAAAHTTGNYVFVLCVMDRQKHAGCVQIMSSSIVISCLIFLCSLFVFVPKVLFLERLMGVDECLAEKENEGCMLYAVKLENRENKRERVISQKIFQASVVAVTRMQGLERRG